MEPTNSQILEAITGLKTEFSGLKTDFAKMQETLDGHTEMIADIKEDVEILKNDMSTLKNDVSTLKNDVTGIKATMVTKDYLDEKLGVTRGHAVELIRKEDERVSVLIGSLHEKDILTDSDVSMLSELKPLASV